MSEHQIPDDVGRESAHVHRLRVRYGECDMQGVVFNANYFAYVDDAIDVWLRKAVGSGYLDFFECQVKKATLEWFSPARAHEVLEVRLEVTRWGRTSFDVTVSLDVGDRHVATGELVLVSVAPEGHTPTPVPDEVREALGTGKSGRPSL